MRGLGVVLICALLLDPSSAEDVAHAKSMENATDTSGILLAPALDSGDDASGMLAAILTPKASETLTSVIKHDTPSPTPATIPQTFVNDTRRDEWIERLRRMELRSAKTGVYRDGSSYPMEEFDSRVSLIIKTFERPSCLLKYVESIRKFYPTMPILIADDSQQISNTSVELLNMKNVLYFPLPFDSGVSAGRNFLIDHVRTPFFIVSDDDNIFTEHTRLQNLLADIEGSGADIVGACNHEGDKECIGDWDLFYRDRVRNPFHKKYEAQYSTLQVREVPHLFKERVIQRDGSVNPNSPYCKESDMVANFFIARTAFVASQVRWDPSFKVGEHEDFFYRAKIARAAIRFCTNTQVKHEHFTCLQTTEQHAHYKTFRDRVRGFLEQFFVKHEPVTTLETPWATITWNCKCTDEYYANDHSAECMAKMADRTDCVARWDTDRITSPTEEEQLRWNDLISAQPLEVEDGVAYKMNQGQLIADSFKETMTTPPKRLTPLVNEPEERTELKLMPDPKEEDVTTTEPAATMMKAMF